MLLVDNDGVSEWQREPATRLAPDLRRFLCVFEQDDDDLGPKAESELPTKVLERAVAAIQRRKDCRRVGPLRRVVKDDGPAAYRPEPTRPPQQPKKTAGPKEPDKRAKGIPANKQEDEGMKTGNVHPCG